MNFLRKKFLILTLLSLASCSFANKKTVELGISSNPSGANILISGRNYGKTPAVLELKPAEITILLSKPGFEKAEIKTSYYGAVRTDVNGKVSADGNRCLLDMASVVFFFRAFSEKCTDFKQKSYQVNLAPSGQYSTFAQEEKPYREFYHQNFPVQNP